MMHNKGLLTQKWYLPWF